MPSKLEIAKDVLQVAVESGADRVGRITRVITDAVREVTREVGDWASDVFEVIEAGQKAGSGGKPKPRKPRASAAARDDN